jgi:RNA polymerase sigma-70 factor (ECF subfamily)
VRAPASPCFVTFSAADASCPVPIGVSNGGLNTANRRLQGAIAQHLDLVWRVLRRVGLRDADAEDAAQDVFWVLAQRLDDVPVQAERAFLAATAFRVASACRRSKRYREVNQEVDCEEHAGSEPLPDRELELRRARALLSRALSALPAPEREVFILAELEQLSRTEVAEALGIPPGTVATRLSRARQSFEASLRALRAKPRNRS